VERIALSASICSRDGPSRTGQTGTSKARQDGARPSGRACTLMWQMSVSRNGILPIAMDRRDPRRASPSRLDTAKGPSADQRRSTSRAPGTAKAGELAGKIGLIRNLGGANPSARSHGRCFRGKAQSGRPIVDVPTPRGIDVNVQPRGQAWHWGVPLRRLPETDPSRLPAPEGSAEALTPRTPEGISPWESRTQQATQGRRSDLPTRRRLELHGVGKTWPSLAELSTWGSPDRSLYRERTAHAPKALSLTEAQGR